MTLQIEEGKFYRTRDGQKVGPMSRFYPGFSSTWSGWTSGRRIWENNGRHGDESSDNRLRTVKRDPQRDLVAEWIEEDEKPRLDPANTDYNKLYYVLDRAFHHAATGKGHERHARGATPFDKQPILEIGRMVGPGFNLGQAMKKAQEASGMIGRGETERATAELLGAINYLAAAVILIEKDA